MLHFVLITPQTSVTSTCDIQYPGTVTTAMEAFHNTCNMCILDLPDMYVLSSHASACISGKYVTTITHTLLLSLFGYLLQHYCCHSLLNER